MYFLTVLILACQSCGIMEKTSIKEFQPQYTPGPQTMVYKTKRDYSKYVPILLSSDKTEIISYPHPNDLIADNRFLFPTVLNDNYLLDNRGINQHVAFLKLTYQEYTALKSVLTLKELFEYILDDDPLTELCDCGNRAAFSDPIEQLNWMISKDKLRKICKTIK